MQEGSVDDLASNPSGSYHYSSHTPDATYDSQVLLNTSEPLMNHHRGSGN